ncbi:hypothetical protein BC629DRAFT_1559415 [Irpex lacteus]|nr:hypothetical protein BC629DRAFT_1559415 [Irpex lacteus]
MFDCKPQEREVGVGHRVSRKYSRCEIGLPCPISESPDFNPIEQAFHTLKARLRQGEHDAINADTHPWLVHQANAPIPALSKACCWVGSK